MRVLLIRHGPTQGNLEGRYIGSTDEPLCSAGILRIEACGVYPAVEEVFVSGMARTRQTARLLFPAARLTALSGFNEMSFGDFECRNAYDMRGDAAYRAWVDGGCQGACPNGESRERFAERVCVAFDEAIAQAFQERRRDAVFVLHGGSIMSIMDRYARPRRSFFDWQIGGGGCISAVAAAKGWQVDPHLSRANICGSIPL